MKHWKLHESIQKQADALAKKMGTDASEKDISNVEEKLPFMKRGPLKKIWSKVVSLWKAFLSPDTPIALKSIIIGSLIYMISPVDVIPDITPAVGLLDDVAIVGAAFAALEKMMPKITEAAKSVVKTGVAVGAEKYLEKKAVDLTPQIDRFVIRQWIKTGIQLFVFIAAVLIVVFSGNTNRLSSSPNVADFANSIKSGAYPDAFPFWGIYIASILFLLSTILYFIRALRCLPTLVDFIKAFFNIKKTADCHGKGSVKKILKKAAAETAFIHFHLAKNNKVIVYSVRSWTDGKFDGWIPSDSELWNMVIHFFSRRISSYVLSVAIYFSFFIWTLRKSVLVSLTGMSFLQLLIFPIAAWF